LKAVLIAVGLALVRAIGLFSYCVVKAVGRWAMTHMSHAVPNTASRFHQLFLMFFHVSSEALQGPTLARVALF
jgi:hypothetical protein